jgi:hypothetical protein
VVDGLLLIVDSQWTEKGEPVGGALQMADGRMADLQPVLGSMGLMLAGRLERRSAESGVQTGWVIENGRWQMANGKGQRANGKGQRANGKGQRAKGKWQMTKGKWQMTKGKGQMANGKWQMANGKGQRAKGKGQRAKGKWERAAFSFGQCARRVCRLRSRFAQNVEACFFRASFLNQPCFEQGP